MNSNSVILNPIITEKSTQLAEKGVYMIHVHTKATKHQVSQALLDLYKVTVQNINIIKRKGKVKRRGRRMNEKKLPDTKIAYITLQKGTLPFFPQA